MIMRSKESFLLFFLLLSISSYEGAFGNKGAFDNDKSDECGEIAKSGKCVQDSETFAKCGLSCSQFYDPGNVAVAQYEDLGFKQDEKSYKLQGKVHTELDDFYDLEIELANKNGKTMSFEDFDGMVTVLAVVPLLPGMAQYYYDMFHRVRNVFPFTVELVLLPVRTSGHDEIVPTLPPKSKVRLSVDVTEEDRGDVISYIDKCFAPGEREIDFDRVTFYIMGISGLTERKISPTMHSIERLIKHYVDEMSFKTREL